MFGCGLCICSHQLLGEASQLTTGLGTNLLQRHIIRNQFIDLFLFLFFCFCLEGVIFVYLLACLLACFVIFGLVFVGFVLF